MVAAPTPPTIGSLCTGYGGLDMAVSAVTGAKLAWISEVATMPARIMAHNMPNVPNFGDLTTTRWDDVPRVDILTAGYPCQPFSNAGKKQGENDDRHLWPIIRRIIRELRPRLVVLENVQGHRSLGFDRVLGDMAEDGMDAAWHSLRASDIGAVHHRDRLFIVATPSDTDRIRPQTGSVWEGGDETEKPFFDIGGIVLPGHRLGTPEHFGEYWPVVDRWASVIGRAAPVPTLKDRAGRVLNPRFEEWAMGLPDGWVTDVPGVTRRDAYEILGNGVVPQQAAHALRHLLDLIPN